MENLYIYTDESGVLDYKNDFYIFSGILFLEKNKMDEAIRKFNAIENEIKKVKNINNEMKGSILTDSSRIRIIKLINKLSFPFFVKINIKNLNENLFTHKKTKQRYLDYAYKIGLKKALLYLNNHKYLKLDEIKNINIYLDQHTTATDGKYELKESILQELKIGMFNFTNNIFYEPICQNIENINLNYYDSKKKTLIRAADIYANYLFRCIKNDKKPFTNFFVCELP